MSLLDLDTPPVQTVRAPELPTMFNVIERFLWMMLGAVITIVLLFPVDPTMMFTSVRLSETTIVVDVDEGANGGTWCYLQVGRQAPQYKHVDGRGVCEWDLSADPVTGP